MKKTLLITGIVLVAGAAVTWLMMRKKKAPEVIPEVVYMPPFLEADSAWANQTMPILSLEQKVGQLFMIESDAGYIEHEDSLMQWISQLQPAGVYFRTAHALDRSLLRKACADTTEIPLFFDADAAIEQLPVPDAYTQFAIHDSAINAEFESGRRADISAAGFHFSAFDQTTVADTVHQWHPYLQDSVRVQSRWLQQLKNDQSKYLLACTKGFNAFADFRQDTLNLRDGLLYRYTDLVKKGLSVIHADSMAWPMADSSQNEDRMSAWIAEYLHFQGLLLSKPLAEGPFNNPYLNAIHAGADMVIVPDTMIRQTISDAITAFQAGTMGQEQLDRRVYKTLLAKGWVQKSKHDPLPSDHQKEQLAGRRKQALYNRMQQASLTIINDTDNLLPLKDVPNDSSVQIVHIGRRTPKAFYKVMPYYCRYRNRVIRFYPDKPLKLGTLRKRTPVTIVHLYDALLSDSVHRGFIEDLESEQEDKRIVVINYGNPQNIRLLRNIHTLVQTWSPDPELAGMTTNLVFGGIPATGRSPLQIDSVLAYEQGLQRTGTTRFAYGCMPEEVGLSYDTLRRIDYIANTVISRRATPGCQVLVARKGKVIWHKTYGHHTYSKRRPVQWTDMYDVASITKVAATTIAAMDLYEKGKFKLDDSLQHYLPDTLLFTSLNEVTFRDILIHKTGLSSGMNILKFLKYQNDSVGRYDRYFCDYADENYCVKIADGFYMDTMYHDSIWIDLTQQWVSENKGYKYSDANFNLLYFMLQAANKHKRPFNHLVKHRFYTPLGLRNTTFLPADTFPLSSIVPTEDEKYWRMQLLHGHVHDPTAALLGGVAGNAGLFSNANDMGVIFQMLLQGGTYGGQRYFKKETVDQWTRKQPGSHRGLGFNKPTGNGGIIAPGASMLSYGHTGFTGCCVWVDPESELVYVFLSNRVHPNATSKTLVQNGTRKRIHQTVYDAMFDQPPMATDTLAPVL